MRESLRSGNGIMALVLVIAGVVIFGMLPSGSWATPGQQVGQSTLPTPPSPTEPAPTDPAPTDPAPTEPAPTEPAPTVLPTSPPVWPTYTPWWPPYPTATPVYVYPTPDPSVRVFRPAPATGGQLLLGVPAILWEAGFGLALLGLGLDWWRRR
jgi:hypothetical protein